MNQPFNHYRLPLSQVLPNLKEACNYMHVDCSDSDSAYLFLKYKLQELGQLSSEAIGGYRLGHIVSLDITSGRLECTMNDANGSVTAVLKPGPQVCGYLKECDEVALFLCTAGHLFRQQYDEYNRRGDILEAYLTDALGSLSVENAMDRIHEALATEMQQRNLKITNRYSPGYCNWPVTDQRSLFDLIGDNQTGISLNDSCLMSPIKSVSGIIGIGEKAHRRAYGCAVCQNKTCIYRRLLK